VNACGLGRAPFRVEMAFLRQALQVIIECCAAEPQRRVYARRGDVSASCGFRSFLAEIEARLELQIARRKLRKTKNSPLLFGE
jgi:hypothetical protein